ncbi:AAA family ATPase [Loktanella sp. SALINAS62]|uniref:AAA family ATPase n=1 Tax=Loktanella sp. SALINAS62 TaxID=2706124 RepID=UPI001B8D6E80|nr:AAA family ATPase [Loktanella sp. SALINAS62]MBS1300735.1 AAA domain-containing protein [Loktanella sp. SALINAS62]
MSINTISISTGQALDALRAGHAAQMAGSLTASWMLHGRPGIGKTDIVTQLATETGSQLFDLRLTTIEPADLRGLPFYDHDTQRTVWYPPEDLPHDPDRPAILFLDELTAAAPALQPTVYGLLQERRVGQHRLPDSTFIVAAGNAVEDGAIAYDMGTALSDRLIHLSLRAEANDWITHYAMPHGLHESVIAFIRTRPDLLDTTEDVLRRGAMIAATPRSWARVSAILRSIPDAALRDTLIAGTVGDAVGAEFALIARDIASTVQARTMIDAPAAERPDLYPRSLHGLTALTYALIALADRDTLPRVIDVMAGLTDLRDHDRRFAALPTQELATYGFELLIDRALAQGWQEAFRESASYSRYLSHKDSA